MVHRIGVQDAGGGADSVSGVRNRYIDALRASAIIRVIVYHSFGWAWLTIALPAMGIMFALAGSLMAASLTAHGARRAVISRIRRLIPALWALGIVGVPLMLIHGWSATDVKHPLDWPRLLFWIVPVGDPPGSSWGQPLWEVLWYLRAYLWFVIASPFLHALYRRAPWPTIAAPLVGLAILMVTGFGLPGWGDAVLWDLATYGACWVAGFAHHDGRLTRMPLTVHFGLVAALASGGMAWLLTHPGPHGIDLNDVPAAQALWSLAFVLAALRWRPTLDWLDHARPLAAAIRLVNARAVTIYLWHNPLISLAGVLLTALTLDDTGPFNRPLLLATVLLLAAAAVAAFGWVEDLAAHRRPALWPLPRREPSPARPSPTAENPHTPPPVHVTERAQQHRAGAGGGPSGAWPYPG
jgi:peptidoglycan/LPS O-acetylase OafA/YrhL